MTRHSRNITIRRFAKQDLGRFAAWVRPQIVAADLNLAVITDTHDRTQWSRTFYGPNGLWHTQEQHWLAGELPIDWRVHLGDLVDGSEPNFLTMWRLRNLVNDYVADSVPFVIAKGNHDDNDKFAERNARFSGSFHPWVFNDLVYQPWRRSRPGRTSRATACSGSTRQLCGSSRSTLATCRCAGSMAARITT